MVRLSGENCDYQLPDFRLFGHHNNPASLLRGEFGFDKDCVLDLDKDFYAHIEESIFLSFKEDITIKGKLSEQNLREIYNLILKSQRIPKIIKKDIHHSFNMAGITGLRKPR